MSLYKDCVKCPHFCYSVMRPCFTCDVYLKAVAKTRFMREGFKQKDNTDELLAHWNKICGELDFENQFKQIK